MCERCGALPGRRDQPTCSETRPRTANDQVAAPASASSPCWRPPSPSAGVNAKTGIGSDTASPWLSSTHDGANSFASGNETRSVPLADHERRKNDSPNGWLLPLLSVVCYYAWSSSLSWCFSCAIALVASPPVPKRHRSPTRVRRLINCRAANT